MIRTRTTELHSQISRTARDMLKMRRTEEFIASKF